MTIHTQPACHLRSRVIEGTAGKRRRRRRIAGMATDAVTRGRDMILRLACRSHTIVTGRTGQPVVGAALIQGRVVEASGEAAPGLMTILAGVRCRRVAGTFTDGLGRIACDMTAYACLGLDSRVLVIDRIGLLEITRRRVTGITFPTIRIHCAMHRIRRMTLGKINRIVVRRIVAGTTTRCVGRMYRIYKRGCRSISTRTSPIDAGPVGGISMTLTAICRRDRYVTRGLCDHQGCVIRFTVVAAAAITGNTCRCVVKGWHGETGESRTMTDQAILTRRRQRHVRQ